MNIEKVTRTTISEQIMEQIKELISSKQYNSGEKLPSEAKIAEMFNVGRASVREAIKILHYMGVLHSNAGKVTFIGNRSDISKTAFDLTGFLNETDIYEILALREAIEQQCIILIIEKYIENPDSLKELFHDLEAEIANLKQLSNVDDDSFADSVWESDYRFHLRIIKAHGNTDFIAIYGILRSFMLDVILKLRPFYSDDISKIWKEHQEILNGIKSKDVNKAINIFKSHIEDIRTMLKRLFYT